MIAESVIGGEENTGKLISDAQRRMSDSGAAIRRRDGLSNLLEITGEELAGISDKASVSSADRLYTFYKLRDILLTQCAVLTAMIGYSDTAGETRGSSLCYDPSGKLRDGFSEPFRFVPESRGGNKEKYSGGLSFRRGLQLPHTRCQTDSGGRLVFRECLENIPRKRRNLLTEFLQRGRKSADYMI